MPGIHVFAAVARKTWMARTWASETTPFVERLCLTMTNANSIERNARRGSRADRPQLCAAAFCGLTHWAARSRNPPAGRFLGRALSVEVRYGSSRDIVNDGARNSVNDGARSSPRSQWASPHSRGSERCRGNVDMSVSIPVWVSAKNSTCDVVDGCAGRPARGARCKSVKVKA
jgi:hypothetical protein